MTDRDKVSNEVVLQMVEEERQLLTTIITRKKKWIGHVLRRNNLLKRTLEGRMLGKRKRGRQRQCMLDDLKGTLTYTELKQTAQHRQLWRAWNPEVNGFWTC